MSTTADDNNNATGRSEEIRASKKECTSCEQNNVENITEDFNSMAVLDDVSTCAACGKEGNSDNMNICNKCKMVKYCNAACKKKHRTKHKKACERRAAELHDEQLFKEPPPREECPICMLLLPINSSQTLFKTCCGKTICDGCVYVMMISEGKDLCPYCRTPKATSDKEHVERVKKLMDKGNAAAYSTFGGWYDDGDMGLTQNRAKAVELDLKAGELGCADGYYNLGTAYRDGNGVEIDLKKANHYYELSAMCGHVMARHNLGCLEGLAGNVHRAMKHFMISARDGCMESLDNVKIGFMKDLLTKDEYASTLRAYQKGIDEMKSDERDLAEALRYAGRSSALALNEE